MATGYTNYSAGVDSPAANWSAVTPANADLPTNCRALWIGGAGDVVVQSEAGPSGPSNTATFAGVPAGTLLPVRALRVLPATTATNIVALW
jgi:hypothetical protein